MNHLQQCFVKVGGLGFKDFHTKGTVEEFQKKTRQKSYEHISLQNIFHLLATSIINH